MNDSPHDEDLLPPEKVWERLPRELQLRVFRLLIQVAYDTVIDSKPMSDGVDDNHPTTDNQANEISRFAIKPEIQGQGKLEREKKV